MKLRKLAALVLGLAAVFQGSGSARAETPPAAAIQDLCDALIASMKEGPAAGFEARRQLLEPHIRGALDLARMTRLVIGPPWRGFTAAQQERLVDAFSDFSIATYANRFSSFSGQKFTVDPNASRLENGDAMVHTTLETGEPEPVKLDYLMREDAGRWRVIDVFLSGTISELAARRSEYSAVLRTGGADALVELLRRKTAELRG
jgi:phospholipid transport system substrate-binding protein